MGLAFGVPDRLLLLTRTAKLYKVPLNANAAMLASVAPQSLAKHHTEACCMAFEPQTRTLVVAGDGSVDATAHSATPATVSVWRLEAGKVTCVGQRGKPPGGGGGGALSSPAACTSWNVSFSPLAEYAAVAAPPGPVHVISLSDGQFLDATEQFAGRTAGPASPTARADTLSRVQSASWWSNVVLGLCAPSGDVTLAKLPGLANMLGPAPEKFAPGSKIVCNILDHRGVYVLELAPPLSTAPAAAPASRTATPSAATAAAEWRLTCLIQRSPEQMMQLLVSKGAWEQALVLAAERRLNADAALRARWTAQPVSASSIQDNLGRMRDRAWVVQECASRVADTFDAQRALLDYGLQEATACAAHPLAAEGQDHVSRRTSAAAHEIDGFQQYGSAAPSPTGSSGAVRALWRHGSGSESAGGGLQQLTRGVGETGSGRRRATADQEQLQSAWGGSGGSGLDTATAAAAGGGGGGWSRRTSRDSHGYGSHGAALPPPPPHLRNPLVLPGGPSVPEEEDVGAAAAVVDDDASDGSDSDSTGADLSVYESCIVKILKYQSRLSSLYEIHDGVYDAAAYAEYRDADLQQAAQSFAAMGNTRGVAAILRHHPNAVRCHLLATLSCIPETVDPRSYADLLPAGDGSVPACADAPTPASPGAASAAAADDGAQLLAAALGGGNADALQADDVAGWYVQRAFDIDACSGQLYHAISLLETGLTRGVGGQVLHMLRLAKCLATIIRASSASPSAPSSAAAAGDVAPDAAANAPSAGWEMGLEQFSRLSLHEQLMLALRGCSERSLEADITTRVTPFLACLDAGQQAAVLQGLLAAEVHARPAWVMRLIQLECGQLRLYPSVPSLVQAVMAAVLDCQPASSNWSSLESILRQVVSLIGRQMANAGGSDGAAATAADELEPLLQAAHELAGCVAAAAALEKQGIAMSVRDIQRCGVDDAKKLVRQILARAQRQGAGWPDSNWTQLWRDLKSIQETGFQSLPRPAMMAEFVRSLLHAGRVKLAHNYLTSTGSGALEAGDAERLVVSVAREILYSAESLESESVSFAQQALQLQPASAAAQAELRLIGALGALPSFGLSLLPAHLGQLHDKFEVVEAVLAAKPDTYTRLPQLVQLARDLGLSDPDDQARVRSAAASAALQAGDVAAAAALAQELAAARYAPAWQLCTEVAAVAEPPAVSEGQRLELLAFASEHCPEEYLGALLDAMQQCERELSRAAEPAARGGTDAAGDSADGSSNDDLAPAARHVPDGGAASPTKPPPQLSDVASWLSAPLPRLVFEALHAGGPVTSKSLPGLGDLPLAAAALLGRGSAADAAVVVRDAYRQCSSFALAQRTLLLGMVTQCIYALSHPGATAAMAGAAAADALQRRQLFSAPLSELMARARRLQDELLAAAARSPPRGEGQGPAAAAVDQSAVAHVSACVAAALEFEALLKTATDSRTMKQWTPDVDTGRFLSDDQDYRKQVVLQNCGLAGQLAVRQAGAAGADVDAVEAVAAAAGGHQDANQLLQEALATAAAYGIDPWECKLRFVGSAIACAERVNTHVKQLVGGHRADLLQRPLEACRQLCLQVYPLLPAASFDHLSVLLHLILDSMKAAVAADSGAATVTEPLASPQQLRLIKCAVPVLQKVAQLLNSAGKALAGLSAKHIIAGFVESVLHSALGIAGPAGSAPDASAEADMPRIECVSAVWAYVGSGNVQQVTKFINSIHVVFRPMAALARTTSGGAAEAQATAPPDGDAASAAPELLSASARALLAVLSPSLPYLALVCKLMCGLGGSPSGGAGSDAQGGGERDSDRPAGSGRGAAAERAGQAYKAAQPYLAKLPPAELVSVVQFLLRQGAQPAALAPDAVGELEPLALPPPLQLRLLTDTLPALTATDAAGGALPADVASAVASLTLQHAKLTAVRCVMQHAGLPQDQAALIKSQLIKADTPQAVSAAAVTGALAAASCPLASVAHVASTIRAASLDAAAAAPADGAADVGTTTLQTVQEGLLSRADVALQQLRDHVTAAPGGGDATSAAGTDTTETAEAALQQLAGLVSCLDGDAATASSAATEVDASSQLEEVQQSLRSALSQRMLALLDALQQDRPGVFQHPLVGRLLEMHGSLGTGQVWAGWSAAECGGDPEQQRLRLLLSRTVAVVSKHWPPQQLAAVTVDSVATSDAAVALFGSLLHAAGGAPERYAVLEHLLAVVWQDGAAWNGCRSAEPVGGGDLGRWAQVSYLSTCWHDLLHHMLQWRHAPQALRLLGSRSSGGFAAPSAVDAGDSGGNEASPYFPVSARQLKQLVDEVQAAAGDTCLAACLCLLSPFEALHAEALRRLDACDPVLLPEPQPATLATLLLLLLARRDAHDAALLRGLATAPVFTLLCQPLSSTAPHPLLSQAAAWLPGLSAVVKALTGPEGGSAADSDALGALFPAAVCELCLGRQYAVAAGLVALRMRVHSAASSLGGALHVLERYLQAACRAPWSPAPGAATLAPAAASALLASLPGRCSVALRQLLQDINPTSA